MCGIVGYTGKNSAITPLIEGLRRLNIAAMTQLVSHLAQVANYLLKSARASWEI